MVDAGERMTAGLRIDAAGLDGVEVRFRGAGRLGAGFLAAAAVAAVRRGFLVTVVVITGGRGVVADEFRWVRWGSEGVVCGLRAPGFLVLLLLLFAAVSVELETADCRDDGRGLGVKVEEEEEAAVAAGAEAVGADEEREEAEVAGTMVRLLLTDLSLGWESLLFWSSSSLTVVSLERFGLRARIFFPRSAGESS